MHETLKINRNFCRERKQDLKQGTLKYFKCSTLWFLVLTLTSNAFLCCFMGKIFYKSHRLR